MADHAWLRNLAAAHLQGGEWAHGDKVGVERLVAARIDEAVTKLYEEAYEACEIYNQYARGKRQARILPLAPKPGDSGGGLILLMGRTQITLTYKPHKLEATLTVVDGFERVTKALHRFVPHVDAFGTVLWHMDNALLLTDELIIKRLMEDITRAGFEIGELKTPTTAEE